MTKEFKIRVCKSVLQKKQTLNALNAFVHRAEKIGIDIQTALDLRNERARELNPGKLNMPFRLG